MLKAKKNPSATCKKKIALIINKMYDLGGTERVTSLLSSELCQYYDCHVVTLFGSEPLAYDVDARVTIFDMYQEPRRLRWMLPQGLIRLHRYLQEHDIHVVMIIGRSTGLLPLLLGLYSDIKVIFAEHSTIVPTFRHDPPKAKAIQRVMDHLISHMAARIVLLTEKEKRVYPMLLPGTSDRLRVIPNFMEDSLLEEKGTYNTQSKLLCTVGWIRPPKGLDYLVEVAERVFQQHPDWEWHIYGQEETAEYARHIESEIQRRGLAGCVRLMGPTQNVYSIMQESAIYVSTSRYEGLPMVLLEAKANGLPTVSFDVYSGPSDIIRDGVDGYLIEPFDTQLMAERICCLIEHPELRQQFSDNAWGNIDKFRKENVMSQWRELIDEVLAENADHSGTFA